MTERPTPEQVFNCPMVENPNYPGELPNDAPTVGVFLTTLLEQLWKNRASFDSKRPYRDSEWELDVYSALGKAGLVECTFDENGYIEEVDTKLADELVTEVISELSPGAK